MTRRRPPVTTVRPTLLAALVLTLVAAGGASADGVPRGVPLQHGPNAAGAASPAPREPAHRRGPGQPTRLRISLARDGSPTLAWRAARGGSVPLRYLVYRDGAYLVTASAPRLTLEGIQCGIAHVLGVRTVDARGKRSVQATTVFRPPCRSTTIGTTSAPAPAPAPELAVPAPAPPAAPMPGSPPAPVAAAPPAPASPIPPAASPCAAPITIRAGGTYTGCWASTTAAPAVRIATPEPVVITDATVQGFGGGTLIAAYPGMPVDVTVRRVIGQGGAGLFFTATGFASVRIESSTVDKTGGIYLVSPRPGATVVVTRNSQRNVQMGPGGELRHFIQLHDATSLGSADVSWNEIVNDFGASSVEDVISLYNAAHVSVHDNFVKGAYPSSSESAYSGSGIMIEAGSYGNRVYDNQVVDTTNVGIGIAGGRDNLVSGNTVLSDGRLDDGTPLAAANVGIFVWNADDDPRFANNRAVGNTVGWHRADGTRNNLWLPDAPATDSALNTVIGDDRLLARGAEQAEWTAWLDKLAAKGIHPGA